MLGTYALSSGYYEAYYLRAQKVRALLARDFAEAFERVDAIVTPTSPTPPFRLGERTADPLQRVGGGNAHVRARIVLDQLGELLDGGVVAERRVRQRQVDPDQA